jgi:hypothetical protein
MSDAAPDPARDIVKIFPITERERQLLVFALHRKISHQRTNTKRAERLGYTDIAASQTKELVEYETLLKRLESKR